MYAATPPYARDPRGQKTTCTVGQVGCAVGRPPADVRGKRATGRRYNRGMLTVAVVEDNPADLQALENCLARFSRMSTEHISVRSFADAASFDRTSHFDAAFIDINLGAGENGMNLAAQLREADQTVHIVFVTSMPQYAVLGYSVHAFAYLLKPLSYGQFEKTMRQIVERVAHMPTVHLQLLSRDGLDVVDARKVCFVETAAGTGRKLSVHTVDGAFGTAQTMRELEERLTNIGFFRCHVSYLVNLRFVEAIHGGEAVVGGVRVPVSRHRKADFVKALARFLGEGML